MLKKGILESKLSKYKKADSNLKIIIEVLIISKPGLKSQINIIQDI